MKKICIIIPAFNEEKSIAKVIYASRSYGDIVVVNDGSTDLTEKISRVNGALVVNNKNNQGYDASILKGINYALKKKYKFVITLDADGQHPVNLIPIFIKYLKYNKYHLVVGNREYFPRLSEKIFNFYTRIFYSIPDVLCGMKGYSVNVLRPLNKKKYLNSVGTYFLLESARRSLKIKILDVPINDRQFNSSKMGISFSANLKIFKALILCIFNQISYLRQPNEK